MFVNFPLNEKPRFYHNVLRFKSQLDFSHWSARILSGIRSVNKMLNDLTPRSNSNWRPLRDADAKNPPSVRRKASIRCENVLMNCEKRWVEHIETHRIGMRSTRTVWRVSTANVLYHTVESEMKHFPLAQCQLLASGDNETETHRNADAAQRSILQTYTWAEESQTYSL